MSGPQGMKPPVDKTYDTERRTNEMKSSLKKFAPVVMAAILTVSLSSVAFADGRVAKSKASPAYPDMAKRMNISGVVKVEVTVAPSGPLGFLTIWPTGIPQPLVSTLNAQKGLIVANAAIVPAGSGGAFSVYVTNTTHVIIDTTGYFSP